MQHDPNAPLRVGIRELRGHLSTYLRMAREGQCLLIMSHDEVLAEIRPPRVDPAAGRQPGMLRGKVRIADDFDLLPDDVLAAIEEGE